MVTKLLAPEAFKVGSKVWVRYLGVIKGHREGVAIRDGLWRPGGAFFQIGFGCVMSHHHREGLCTFLFKCLVGKFKMEFLPTNSLTKAFPVTQICPHLHKIVPSKANPFIIIGWLRSLKGQVQGSMRCWKRFYVSLDKSVLQGMLL